MKYVDLQGRLKQYQIAGIVKVKLNSSLAILGAEYQRCLDLGLSQTDLERLASIRKGENLDLILPFDIYTYPENFTLKIVKAKTYALGQVKHLQELKLAFPIFKNKQYNFRTKNS